MAPVAPSLQTPEVVARAQGIFEAQRQAIYRRTDKLFAGLMAVQWAGAIAVACWLSPRTWAGTESAIHPHVWAAVFIGGLISLFPICLALLCPGQAVTRQVIAVSQLLMSGLLIHVSGGRLATHFHIFGSLAFLAFYRDWRILLSATIVTTTDHFVRGFFWPQSVYGLAFAAPWLSAEHAGWVLFTDTFLLISCRQGLLEMSQISLRQAQLEVAETILIQSHETLETRVAQRTQALTQMQRQNALLLDAAGEGIYGLDTNGITQFVNPAAAKMLGYEAEEIIGQPMHPLLHHTYADGRAFPSKDCSIYRCLHTGEPCRVDDEVFWRKDGTAFDVEYLSTPIYENGRIAGAVVTFQDISERRQTSEALRQRTLELSSALQEHQNVMATVPDILFRLDLAGHLRQWNRRMEMVTGLSAEALRGMTAVDLFCPEDQPAILEAIKQAFETGHAVVEGSLLHQEGSATLHQLSAGPLRGPDGEIIGLTGMGRDITERKRAEENILALNREIVQAYDATIEGWSRALDLRDHETEGHSRRVTDMTLRLAEAVGIPEPEIIHIRRGALLHDIGKMGVPDAILLKPGPLDDREWEIMRRHPALAKSMLDPAEFLHPALIIPYCHHEKWDGTGYPQGLRGEQIPLSARLFALVDVWDALSSDRPYRTAWPIERILDHLHSLAGTHFDPEIVSVFLYLLEEDQRLPAEPSRLQPRMQAA